MDPGFPETLSKITKNIGNITFRIESYKSRLESYFSLTIGESFVEANGMNEKNTIFQMKKFKKFEILLVFLFTV
jgi:hypothetical protein